MVKKSIYFLVILSVLFVSTSFVASAISFEGDASYLVGVGTSKSQGFVAHAMIEVIDHIFADGSFLNTNVKKSTGGEGADSTENNSLFTIGGLYRPVNDSDLQVFVGAGYLGLTTKVTGSSDSSGQGIYGKFGFRFLPLPQLSLMADVSYAPLYKEKDTDKSGHLVSTRATASYEVMDGVSVQGTIKHYRTSVTTSQKDILVGGGITFRF